MAFKTGILGLGYFGRHFVELFQKHPYSGGVALCERRRDVLEETAREHGVANAFTDFEEMLKTDIDAVAIFTQRWSHAPLAIRALKAGKHVYSAVPAGVTVEELDELVKTVEETGLTYALGETSFYRPQTIWCRREFARGRFGAFVYGEGQYYHNMASWFYLPFYDANGPEWQRFASVPPMWYISHSASHVLSVTMSRFTWVSCLGWRDDHFGVDGIFNRERSAFDNDFSNQTALFRTADGGMVRVNEFRRSAAGESRMAIIGTQGAYQEQCNPHAGEVSVEQQIYGTEAEVKDTSQSEAVFTEIAWKEPPYREDGSFDHRKAEHSIKKVKTDLTPIHRLDGVEITEGNLGNLPRECLGRRHLGVSRMHEVARLPAEFVGLRNGHCGSHQFLVHDFFEAMQTGKLPPNHVWIGARYSVGGAVAHESSKRDGEPLAVPDFGVPPADKACVDPLVQIKPDEKESGVAV
jgi:predicted dehydrogenase